MTIAVKDVTGNTVDVATNDDVIAALQVPAGPGTAAAARRNVTALASTGTQTSVAASTSDVTVLAANASRLGFVVFNDSAATLYLLLANATSSETVYSVRVDPGTLYQNTIYAGVVKGLWSAADGAARVTEFA